MDPNTQIPQSPLPEPTPAPQQPLTPPATKSFLPVFVKVCAIAFVVVATISLAVSLFFGLNVANDDFRHSFGIPILLFTFALSPLFNILTIATPILDIVYLVKHKPTGRARLLTILSLISVVMFLGLSFLLGVFIRSTY